MARAAVFSALVLLLPALALTAQSLDEFFEEPEGSEEGENPADGSGEEGSDGAVGEADGSGEEGSDGAADDADGPDEGVDLDALTTAPTEVSLSVSGSAGAALGFEEWPESEAAEGREPRELLRGTGVYDMAARLSVDARPEPYLRFYGALRTELNEEAMSFTGPAVDELFVDYTLKETVFFRAGKQKLTWGQGRLLSNPANVVSRLSDGIGLRGTSPVPRPVGGGSVTGVLYSLPAWVEEYRPGHPAAFAYAGLYENRLGPVSFELSSHYKEDEPVGSAGSFSFGLGPVDFSFEVLGRWDSADPGSGFSDYGSLAQLLWESPGRNWSLLGEYEFDSAVADYQGHFAAVGLQGPGFGGGWRPRLRWKHAFQDNSGELVPTISGTVAPRLTASLGLPIVYGEPGSYYREAQNDPADEDEQAIPVDDVVALLLGVQLDFTF